MSCLISSINYSPVKSLSFESVNSCEIKKDLGIHGSDINYNHGNENTNTVAFVMNDTEEKYHLMWFNIHPTICALVLRLSTPSRKPVNS